MKIIYAGSIGAVYNSNSILIGYCGRVSDFHNFYYKQGNQWVFDQAGKRPVFFLSRETCHKYITELEE